MTEAGIVGLPQSGKSTLMSALTGAPAAFSSAPGEAHRGVIPVPDERVDRLAEIYRPKKTTYATLQVTDLVGAHGVLKKGELFTPAQIGHLRDMDLLLLVIRLFTDPAIPHPLSRIDPAEDLSLFLEECLLSDLAVAEKRIDRIESDLRKGGAGRKKEDLELEKKGLVAIRAALEEESPVAAVEITEAQRAQYKGFGFLTGKRILPVVNSGDATSPSEKEFPAQLEDGIRLWNAKSAAWSLPSPILVNAKLEMELRDLVGPENLGGEEAMEYYREVGLQGPSSTEIVQTAYSSLGLISFLTVGEDEVRAWTVEENTTAQAAAGAIHSDLERGFIRAEVVGYKDFIESGTMGECRKKGVLRLEGRDHKISDGDILNVHFSV